MVRPLVENFFLRLPLHAWITIFPYETYICKEEPLPATWTCPAWATAGCSPRYTRSAWTVQCSTRWLYCVLPWKNNYHNNLLYQVHEFVLTWNNGNSNGNSNKNMLHWPGTPAQYEHRSTRWLHFVLPCKQNNSQIIKIQIRAEPKNHDFLKWS